MKERGKNQCTALLVLTTMLLTAGRAATSTDGTGGQQIADIVYTNGRIYTVNEAQPWAEAVAIREGKFLVVGSNAEAAAVTGESTEIHDLDGQFVMPGIFDLHSHPFITPWYGGMNLQLAGADTRGKILAAVEAYALSNPEKEWIIGGQWLLGILPGDSPRKEWLDELCA